MKQVPDRKKLRREYLMKQARTISALSALDILAGFLLAGIITCCVLAILSLMTGWILPIVATAAITIFFHFIRAEVVLNIRSDVKRAMDNTPYVPPVTASTLPADEILVRGSEEPPVAQSETLLRATLTAQETPKEELLCVSEE